MSCETGCFEMQIECCESPVIKAGLTPGDDLMALITRPGSKTIYKREVTVDADGAITIDKATLPDGFLAYGYIELELRKGAGFTDVQTMTFGAVSYSCALLELVDVDLQPDEE